MSLCWGFGRDGQTGHKDVQRCQPTVRSVSDMARFSNEGMIKQVACGYQHTVVLLANGDVYAWGDNEFGQLGTGDERSRRRPRRIRGFSQKGVRSIVAGAQYTMAITTDGAVLSCGRFQFANEVTIRKDLVSINITSVSCGFSHAVARTDKGELWTWGYNEFGQLGDGNVIDCLHSARQPRFFQPIEFKQVSCGAYHSVALDTSGGVWSWGKNHLRQLGHSPYHSVMPLPKQIDPNQIDPAVEIRFIQSGRDFFLIAQQDGTVTQIGILDPLVRIHIGGVLSISCGDDHFLALTDTGEMYGWGYNAYGQTGIPVTDKKSQRVPFPTVINRSLEGVLIAAGGGHSVAVVRPMTLKSLCALALKKMIDESNVCDFLEFAVQYHVPSLISSCVTFMDEHFDQLICSGKIQQLSRHAVALLQSLTGREVPDVTERMRSLREEALIRTLTHRPPLLALPYYPPNSS
eukprot:GILK01006026.1.p1 GENE.GILK01006026.1~~GILK01006026.1.p1  ORF type:complete len:461 (+),score=58.97 GILK01006026.1:46-1428(+)